MSVNKLIQLSEWEYNKLVGKANANDKSIEELAEAMYNTNRWNECTTGIHFFCK